MRFNELENLSLLILPPINFTADQTELRWSFCRNESRASWPVKLPPKTNLFAQRIAVLSSWHQSNDSDSTGIAALIIQLGWVKSYDQ
jgi:hypothetical protein